MTLRGTDVDFIMDACAPAGENDGKSQTYVALQSQASWMHGWIPAAAIRCIACSQPMMQTRQVAQAVLQPYLNDRVQMASEFLPYLLLGYSGEIGSDPSP